MTPVKLAQHLNTKHKDYADKPVRYFKDLKVKRETERPKRIEALFRKQMANRPWCRSHLQNIIIDGQERKTAFYIGG